MKTNTAGFAEVISSDKVIVALWQSERKQKRQKENIILHIIAINVFGGQ